MKPKMRKRTLGTFAFLLAALGTCVVGTTACHIPSDDGTEPLTPICEPDLCKGCPCCLPHSAGDEECDDNHGAGNDGTGGDDGSGGDDAPDGAGGTTETSGSGGAGGSDTPGTGATVCSEPGQTCEQCVLSACAEMACIDQLNAWADYPENADLTACLTASMAEDQFAECAELYPEGAEILTSAWQCLGSPSVCEDAC